MSRPLPIMPDTVLAPEKPDYYDAMPADLKARYDASTPEQQLRFQQGITELREMLREAEAGGVSTRSFDDAVNAAEDRLRREGVY